MRLGRRAFHMTSHPVNEARILKAASNVSLSFYQEPQWLRELDMRRKKKKRTINMRRIPWVWGGSHLDCILEHCWGAEGPLPHSLISWRPSLCLALTRSHRFPCGVLSFSFDSRICFYFLPDFFKDPIVPYSVVYCWSPQVCVCSRISGAVGWKSPFLGIRWDASNDFILPEFVGTHFVS